MKFCQTCGAQIHDDAVICIHCGCAVPQTSQDHFSMGFAVLSFLVPIAGFIIYLCLEDKKPLKANSCKWGALIKIAVLAFVFGLVSIITNT
ncbi:MAG: hypothetical protein IJW62_09275 [Clostridia bacterium]|nr:hypothetical protein [Clostridia bacterium]